MDLISELSEDCWCAEWLDNIELELWSMGIGNSDESTISFWKRRGDLVGVQDLKRLSDLTQSWAMWEDGLGDAFPIELKQWLPLYQKHISEGHNA